MFCNIVRMILQESMLVSIFEDFCQILLRIIAMKLRYRSPQTLNCSLGYHGLLQSHGISVVARNGSLLSRKSRL